MRVNLMKKISVLILFFLVGANTYSAVPPKGNFDRISSSGVAHGWTYDPDEPAKSISVHYYVVKPGGQTEFAGAASANRPRQDVNNAFGITGQHGVAFTIPQKYWTGQTHTLRMYGIDSQGGSNPMLGSKSFNLSLPNVAPTVSISSPSNGSSVNVGSAALISASASDSDGVVTRVEFYFGGSHLGSDTSAPYQINWSPSSAGSHSIYVRAFDNDGAVKQSSSVSVNAVIPNLPPKGKLDNINSSGSTWGWAFDPNEPSKSINTHYYVVDSSGAREFAGGVVANRVRQDVNNVHNISGNHGAVFEIPKKYWTRRPHTLQMYALDSQGGTNPLVGTREFTLGVRPKGVISTIDSSGTTNGWAYDPDTSSDSVTVEFGIVRPDGSEEFIESKVANLSRADVNNAEGISGQHGTSFTVPLAYWTGETHTLNFYAVDVQGGQKDLIHSRTFSLTNEMPKGRLDSISEMGNVWGWAVDPDEPSKSIRVHYYVVKPDGTREFVGSVVADRPRSDLGTDFNTGDHGASFIIPQKYWTGEPHTLQMYALDSFGGHNPMVGEKIFSLDRRPIGRLESIDENGKSVGWAFDPDEISKSINTHYYLVNSDGTKVMLGGKIANLPRSDVNNEYSITGDHGVEFTIPKSYWDREPHTLEMYGIDSFGEPGMNKRLGALSFTLGKRPKGIISEVDNSGVTTGWAYDPDESSNSVSVEFFIRTPGSVEVFVESQTANLPRPDVNAVENIAGDHGTSFTVPQEYWTDEEHTLLFSAVDLQSGKRELLSSRPFVLSNALPKGNLDSISNEGEVRGWAFDPDEPEKSINVHYYAIKPDGSRVFVGAAVASQLRQDVNNVHNISGGHGAVFEIPSEYWDREEYTLQMYALDSWGGANLKLGEMNFILGENSDDVDNDVGDEDGTTVPKADGRVIFIHTDLLGSPAAETDENGNVR